MSDPSSLRIGQHAETWRAVPSWDGYYEVSDAGRVRSVGRVITNILGQKRTIRGGIMTPMDNGNGYLMVRLSKNCMSKKEYVHRLVARAFLGVPETQHCVGQYSSMYEE